MNLTRLAGAASIVASLLAILSATTAARAETVYKCRNPQGDLVYQQAPCAKETESISSWAIPSAEPQTDDAADAVVDGVLILNQRQNGHYLLNGRIKGKPLTFIIDTGASAVSLSRSVAMSAQIYCRDQVLMRTSNGATSACTAIIPSLDIGPFKLKNVPAIIMPNLDHPLLGMNVLQNFRVEQENGEMRISIRR
ncbi:MAG TPA: TIGR02281 family clan AA aspartic protease [Gallionella sp.]|nr:TIGR02281 family clan AA aspartic protease [Gallionella sp.]